MKLRVSILAALLGIGITMLLAQQPDHESMKADAERYYAEGSYARAHDIYTKLDGAKLSASEARWVQFRLADTLWRSQAATETADSTKFDQARQQLEVLVRDITREEDRDRIWVEVQESLGDFYWTRRDSRNWSQGWAYYQQALDWWAGSDNIELGRQRYLKIVWTIARPAWVEPYYYYGYYGNIVPLETLQNVLKIAQNENDKAHAHYLIAMTLRYQGGDYAQRNRIPEEFEAALKAGKSSDWYDDSLFYYAEWMMQSGRMIRKEDGQFRQEPDFAKALELFRQLIAQHVKGESKYYDQAKQQIENITKPVVSVSVTNIFLPGSEIQYYVSWRNTKRIDMDLYPVDLNRDVQFTKDTSSGAWLQQINITGRKPLKSWSKETADKGDYKPGQETMRLDGKLPSGAFLLEAKITGASARELILVTDTSLVLKTSGKKALIYYCSAMNGAPISGAAVKVWEKYYNGSEHVWRLNDLTTNQDGLALAELFESTNNSELFVSAISKDRQAFSTGYGYGYYSQPEQWRIYAFTDRPAYRPAEQAQWKFVARRYDGAVYSTPANQTIEYELYDPRGTKVKEEKVKLNAFGSAWGSLDLTEAMPLGEYRVNFYDEGRHNGIGSATLLRIEEYKLPEFKVTIQTPEENGKKKAFRLGDSVEVNVQAEYYFGGGVSNANVELLIYQNPFYQWWSPVREFPWYYEDTRPQYYYGNGQIIKRETLKTDATGKAVLSFDTPKGTGQDLQYRIEARVTDASRREITANETVRVTRQTYYVYPQPKHYLYRPQDKVEIDIKALDANDQPVAVEGMVKVTRDFWFEIWLDPDGKEVKGPELQELRDRLGIFPPPPSPDGQSWKLKFRGYQHDDILTRAVKTDANGEAEFTFTPERDGYYRVHWTSEDKDAPVMAETTVWVATNATTELGYRHGGLEIIVDKDTFRAGQTAPVMLSVPANDRYVLFSVEGEDLYSYQLVHLTGTVKLVELPIEEKHVPNIFLSGVLVSDRQIFMDTKQVVVPPVEHFLQVDVKPDRSQYQPREDGSLTVTTRDHEGKPVSAEVALGLVDESVFYIQQDYAGDPRQFYYGTKRQQRTQTQSTFNMKSYTRLVVGGDDVLRDEREMDRITVGTEGATPTAYDSFEQLKSLGYVSNAQVARKSEARSDVAKDGSAMPASAPAPMEMKAAIGGIAGGKVGGVQPPEPNVIVRSDFRSTVLWQPDVVTGKDGTATVKLKFPDALTSWKATARVITAGNQFGIASNSTRTRQPLIVRLQAPRFFVVGDTVTISAIINNNTDSALSVSSSLEAAGVSLGKSEQAAVNVPANGEKRVDWSVSVQQAGDARLKVTARGGSYADAMEKMYLVYEHGIEKFAAKSGKVRGEDVTVNLQIPAERKKESTTMTVQITPSMAVTMLDALPYLIDYPYGCTEQTMSRFLPAAIVAKTLKDLGLPQSSIEGRLFGGIEPESAGKTHPKGKKDLRELSKMIREGLDRLYDFQHPDGGWGWWKEGESDHFMSAYVVWGMTVAQKAGIEIRGDVLNRGVDFLQKELVEEEESYDEQAWMLHALSAHHSTAGSFESRAFDNLWNNRDRLNAYTRALLALSAQSYGYKDKADVLLRNLENGVKIDNAPDTSIVMRGAQQSSDAVIGTAHWGEDGIYWRWSDGGVEATSFALQAFLAIDPQNKLVEPITNWLLKNRRGAQWSNTRDTAITVLTMTDYLRKSGELKTALEYELSVNGIVIATKRVTPEEILTAPSQFAVDRKYIKDGVNEIRIRRKSGDGPIYFAAYTKYFSLEEPVTASGNEIFVRRQYYKYVGKPTLLKGYVYERHALNDGESVKSGERVEVVVTIEAKNNYEYLVFEDLKPAGLEAVAVRSGEPLYAKEIKSGAIGSKVQSPKSKVEYVEQADYTGRDRWVYQELRDRKVALFVDKLPEGVWEIRYDLRAEVPGSFHALPLMGYAMYVPEIRANDVELRIKVED